MSNKSREKYPARRMVISVNMEKTGSNIKRIIERSGYSMEEIMIITGITTRQTIYKWYSGKSIPSLENLIILCRLFDLKITELLVIDGEPYLFGGERAPDNSSEPDADTGCGEKVSNTLSQKRLSAYCRKFLKSAA